MEKVIWLDPWDIGVGSSVEVGELMTGVREDNTG